MQALMGYMRRAMEDYRMLADGDRVAVGVSGGKDSVAMLAGLAHMRRFLGLNYHLTAITLDLGFGGAPGDYSAIAALCRELDVPYILKRTSIGPVVFDIRKEPNPCSLCARMRRGALHDAAKEADCNKVALGHHRDDAVETFVMNLFYEGRVGCFSPVSYLSRKDLTMIRPLLYAPEQEIIRTVRRLGLPVVTNPCPANGRTKRQEVKEFLLAREKGDNGFTDRLFGALQRSGVDHW